MGAFRRSVFYAELLRVLGDDQLQSELYLQSAAEQAGLEYEPVGGSNDMLEDELMRDQIDGRLPLEGGANRLPSELLQVMCFLKIFSHTWALLIRTQQVARLSFTFVVTRYTSTVFLH